MAPREGGRVILLVEDEPVNRSLVRAVLRSSVGGPFRDADLVEAATLAEARVALDEHRPDIVILDVRLPDGDGLQLARDVRERGGDDGPRILVLSASVRGVDRDLARVAGGHAFLGKPFLPRDLVEALTALVQDDPAGAVSSRR